MTPDDYVVRSVVSATPERVTVTVVDMAGAVVHVTVPRALTTSEQLDPIIRARLAARRPARRPTV